MNQQAVCSCLPNYLGSPPDCRPECTVSSECALTRACTNQKCVDPCPGLCGLNADCKVLNHSPICACKNQFTGDPFTRCFPVTSKPVTIKKENLLPSEKIKDERNEDQEFLYQAISAITTEVATPTPCFPSPCGPFAECRDVRGIPSCSCMPNYIGTPPNCKPECSINSECAAEQACINEKCRNPCAGSCGVSAICNVYNHVPVCTCPEGFSGDPFISCQLLPPPTRKSFCAFPFGITIKRAKLNKMCEFDLTEAPIVDACNPSPCGPNTRCNNGICTCLAEYQGDPYIGCRPECVLNNDCPNERACIRNRCQDPCAGTCGQSALCNVYNHVPMCSCPAGMTGNAFVMCMVARGQFPSLCLQIFTQPLFASTNLFLQNWK